MADDELRHLERAARDAQDDSSAWIRYVRALDRKHQVAPDDLELLVKRVRASFADSPEHATLAEGDEVWVDEQNNLPWIRARWRGVVTNVALQPSAGRPGWYLTFRVRPILPDEDDPEAEPLPFRISILPEQRVRGLQLQREDRLELIARKRPEGP
jgi:hypothetical protein